MHMQTAARRPYTWTIRYVVLCLTVIVVSGIADLARCW